MNQKKKNLTLSAVSTRFKEKVIDKAEDYVPFGWECWIKPLEVTSFDGKIITLYHPEFPEERFWIKEHYGKLILELLNEGVKDKIAIEFTNEVKLK